MATLNPASPKVLRALSRRIFFVSHHVSAFYAVTLVTASVLLCLVLGMGFLWSKHQALAQQEQTQIVFTLPPALADQRETIEGILKADVTVLNLKVSPLKDAFPDQTSLSHLQTPLFVTTLTVGKNGDLEKTWKNWQEVWPFLIRLHPDTHRQGERIKDRLILNLGVFALSLILFFGAHVLLVRSVRVTLKPVADTLDLFDAQGAVWRRLWNSLPQIPMLLCCLLVMGVAVGLSWPLMGADFLYRMPLLLLIWAGITAAVCLMPWRLVR